MKRRNFSASFCQLFEAKRPNNVSIPEQGTAGGNTTHNFARSTRIKSCVFSFTWPSFRQTHGVAASVVLAHSFYLCTTLLHNAGMSLFDCRHNEVSCVSGVLLRVKPVTNESSGDPADAGSPGIVFCGSPVAAHASGVDV